MLKRAFLLFTFMLLTGCATQFENQPLTQNAVNAERRSIDTSHKERPVILVAISGGGSRAAALGWVVLNELKNFHYVSDGQSRRLIDDVTMISSVSGGSVIAAYYGLYGPEALDRFEPEFLESDNMDNLITEILNPFTWVERLVNGTTRTEVAEKMFDEQLFHNQTFADLNQPGKPFIIINATDMASGEVFSLTPDRFDDICSDLDKLPVATGVAASAAVPVVLSPIPLQNFAVSHCQGRPVPAWIDSKLNSVYEPYLNLEAYKRARYTNDLRRGPERFRDIRYLYLVDGGLSDNLGVHGLLDVHSSPRGMGRVLHHIEQGDIKKLVVIVINAQVDDPSPVYESPTWPGLIAMIKSVTSVPIESATASSNAQLKDVLEKIQAASRDGVKNPKLNGLKVYGVQVDLDQLRGNDMNQRALLDKAASIPTSWDISGEDRKTLKEAGQLLLQQHPCFQKLLLDVKADAPFADRTYAAKGCPE